MNKVIISGNLVKDIEINKTQNDISVARFIVAVQRKYSNENGEREADFLNCVAWRNQAENLAKYCKKGDKVGVIGTIQTRNYEKDGEKRFLTEIIADEIEYLYIKPAKETEKTASDEFTPIDDDDLPF